MKALASVADNRGFPAYPPGRPGMKVRSHAALIGKKQPAAKNCIVTATGDRTIRSIIFDIVRRNVWPAPYSGRVLQNAFSEKWRGREGDLLQHQDEEGERYAAARAAGDFDTAAVIAGEVVDLI